VWLFTIIIDSDTHRSGCTFIAVYYVKAGLEFCASSGLQNVYGSRRALLRQLWLQSEICKYCCSECSLLFFICQYVSSRDCDSLPFAQSRS
jgi:hypothetical protein